LEGRGVINSRDYKALFEDKLGIDLEDIERVKGGRNSRVFCLIDAEGRYYAAKVYYQDSADRRRRLQTEFGGLTFLWRNGIRAIPKPLIADPIGGFAIYEYVEGQPVDSRKATPADIDSAAKFLASLQELKNRPDAKELPVASEACFSFAAVLENIERRLRRLEAAHSDDLLVGEMHRFLAEEIRPFFAHMKKWSFRKLSAVGLDKEVELPLNDRTLSPSDFGFHNALRQADGKLIFVDFEYFGWDDPAKMIIDFVLHPAMDLGNDLKQRFVDGLMLHFGRGRTFTARLVAAYPLFGIKWCTILLNEFLPTEKGRRDFAEFIDRDRARIRERQLVKARKMLETVEENYERQLGFN
jgi:thiamine kinase-like enzyme